MSNIYKNDRILFDSFYIFIINTINVNLKLLFNIQSNISFVNKSRAKFIQNLLSFRVLNFIESYNIQLIFDN